MGSTDFGSQPAFTLDRKKVVIAKAPRPSGPGSPMLAANVGAAGGAVVSGVGRAEPVPLGTAPCVMVNAFPAGSAWSSTEGLQPSRVVAPTPAASVQYRCSSYEPMTPAVHSISRQVSQ